MFVGDESVSLKISSYRNFPPIEFKRPDPISQVQPHSLGDQLEDLAGNFLEQAFDPALMTGIAGSMGAFGCGRLLTSRLLRNTGFAHRFGERGLALAGIGGGFAVEVPAFVLGEKGAATALGRLTDWSFASLWKELKGAAVLLGALKLFTGTGRWLSTSKVIHEISAIGGLYVGGYGQALVTQQPLPDPLAALVHSLALHFQFKFTSATLPFFFGPVTRFTERMDQANAVGEGEYWAAAKELFSPRPRLVMAVGGTPKEIDTLSWIFSKAVKDPGTPTESAEAPRKRSPRAKSKTFSSAEILAKHQGVLPALLMGYKPVSLVKAEGEFSSLSRWRFVEVDGRDMILELVPAPEGVKYWDQRFAGKPGNRKRLRGPFGLTDYFKVGDILQILPAVAGAHEGYPLEKALEIEPALLSRDPNEVEVTKRQLIQMAKEMTPSNRLALLVLILNRLNSVQWDDKTDFQPHAIFDILSETLPMVDQVDRPVLLGTLDPFLKHENMQVSGITIGRLLEIDSFWVNAEEMIVAFPIIMAGLEAESRENPNAIEEAFSRLGPGKRILDLVLAMDYRMVKSTPGPRTAAYFWISNIFPKLERADQQIYLQILLERLHDPKAAAMTLELLDKLAPYFLPEDITEIIGEIGELTNAPESHLRILATGGLGVFFRALSHFDQMSVLKYFCRSLFDRDPFLALETAETVRSILEQLSREQVLYLSRDIASQIVEGREEPRVVLGMSGAIGVIQRLYRRMSEVDKKIYFEWLKALTNENSDSELANLGEEILRTLPNE